MHRNKNVGYTSPKATRQAIKRDHRQQLTSPLSSKVSPRTKKQCFNIPTDGVVPSGSKVAGPPTVLTIVQVPGKKGLQQLPSPSMVNQLPVSKIVDVVMSSLSNQRSDPDSSGLWPLTNSSSPTPPPTPTPKPPNMIQDFLEDFKRKMDEGLDFLKGKIPDPTTGLETKVADLEKCIWEKEDGLNDKVDDLITEVKDPTSGLVSKVNQLINSASAVPNSGLPSSGQFATPSTQQ